MPTLAKPQKTECLNPNSGRSIKIDKTTYDLFSKAIYHTLKKGKALSYTQIVDGIYDCFQKKNNI